MPDPLSTSSLLSAIASLSGGKIAYPDEVGFLYEAALSSGRRGDFEEMCFHAKFADRTYRILGRIGRDGNGADVLQRELSAALGRVTGFARLLAEAAPQGPRERLTSQFLALTPEAARNLITLCYDLSWYKNWQLDQKQLHHPKRGKLPEP